MAATPFCVIIGPQTSRPRNTVERGFRMSEQTRREVAVGGLRHNGCMDDQAPPPDADDELLPSTPEEPAEEVTPPNLGLKFAELQASTRLKDTFAKLALPDSIGAKYVELNHGFDGATDILKDMASRNLAADLTFDLPEIDYANMPESRAARASEQTAAHLEVLVNAALVAQAEAAKTEKREQKMLRWTQASVVLAAIAALAGIAAIFFA